MNSGAAWSGWILFAAVMMGLMGAYNALQGLAAIFSDDYYVGTEDELLIFDFTTWGVITLAWGVVLLLAAFALFTGKGWGRWLALAIVATNAVAQSAFLAAFPLWSILVIGISILVIFALTARWDEAQADLEGPA
jgi:hypothetical protein